MLYQCHSAAANEPATLFPELSSRSPAFGRGGQQDLGEALPTARTAAWFDEAERLRCRCSSPARGWLHCPRKGPQPRGSLGIILSPQTVCLRRRRDRTAAMSQNQICRGARPSSSLVCCEPGATEKGEEDHVKRDRPEVDSRTAMRRLESFQVRRNLFGCEDTSL